MRSLAWPFLWIPALALVGSIVGALGFAVVAPDRSGPTERSWIARAAQTPGEVGTDPVA